MNKDQAPPVLTKESYLQRMFEKQTQTLQEVAKEAMASVMDPFVEGMVYHGDPVLNPKVRHNYGSHLISLITVERECKCIHRATPAERA
jgi:hypothetical protein